MNLSKILDKKKKYLLACSFGPDSMSLFFMLLSQGYSFEVAHVNYGLRKEANKETENLTNFCNENNIVIHTLFANVDHSNNIEEECRKIRYNFFYELNKENNFNAVLIAHNQDDLLETYLLQKKRKIYVNYYGIMQNINIFGINVVRPLLSLTKKELEDFCVVNNVPFAIDSSNLTDAYERNKIRHHIVSKMSFAERQELINKIILENKNLDVIRNKIKNTNIHNNNELILLSDDEFNLAINASLKELDSSLAISRGCCHEIRNVLISKKPNVEFKINNTVSFVKEYDKSKFVSNKKEVTYIFEVKKPSLIDTPFFYFDFSKDLDKRNLTLDDFPLTIRTFQPNDFYKIKNYSVTVRRLFIDWKMPMSLRKQWPLVLNKHGDIKYIPRYRDDFNVQKSPDFFVKS